MQPPDGSKKEKRGQVRQLLVLDARRRPCPGVNLNIKSSQYLAAGQVMEYVGIYLRGVTDSRIAARTFTNWRRPSRRITKKKAISPAVPYRGRPMACMFWARPDQRLSWMTQLLPYLANGAFKSVRFDTSKAWSEDTANQKAGFIVIPHLSCRSPRTTPITSTWNIRTFWSRVPEGGGTHFIGIAGVGLDAAVSPGDPATAKKIGIFGYDRETKTADIKDGLDRRSC